MSEREVEIGEIGEFRLIARIAELVGQRGEGVLIGIGDDTALLEPSRDFCLLATCDVQVEGVHFLREAISPSQLGRRTLAINLSDIAAMGGIPRWAILSLVLPPDLPLSWVDEFYAGLQSEGQLFQVSLVGGNLSRSPGPLIVDLTLFGEVEPDIVVERRGARPGDLLLVTGELGLAGAGLLLLRGKEVSREEGQELIQAFLTPRPRVREGRLIATSRLARAMIDLSDGLASDLHRLCEASGVGARIDAMRLPFPESVRRVARERGIEPLELVLFGGEDYELLVAVSPEDAPVLVRLLEDAGVSASLIGEVCPQSDGISMVFPDGSVRPLPSAGWDHFVRGKPHR
ncbi:MAG: thiamine-phosphate kinase [Armatimonadota bacterium]|nr:thiamine-phosphate kinase [Armatimonadota bacterium]MDR5703612.1 thiamine-phosphate kinase [Armatimonadota bacterium]MDR7435162.1 thiamine-phosphate kinase [Armatimonadota bacterium]